MFSRALRPAYTSSRASPVAAPLARLSSASKSALALQNANKRATLNAALQATRCTAVGTSTGAQRNASTESNDGSIQVSWGKDLPPTDSISSIDANGICRRIEKVYRYIMEEVGGVRMGIGTSYRHSSGWTRVKESQLDRNGSWTGQASYRI